MAGRLLVLLLPPALLAPHVLAVGRASAADAFKLDTALDIEIKFTVPGVAPKQSSWGWHSESAQTATAAAAAAAASDSRGLFEEGGGSGRNRVSYQCSSRLERRKSSFLEHRLLLPACYPTWLDFVTYAIGDMCASTPEDFASPARRGKALFQNFEEATLAMRDSQSDELSSELDSSVLLDDLADEQSDAAASSGHDRAHEGAWNNKNDDDAANAAGRNKDEDNNSLGQTRKHRAQNRVRCTRLITHMVATMMSALCYVPRWSYTASPDLMEGRGGVFQAGSEWMQFPPAEGDLRAFLLLFLNTRYDLAVLALSTQKADPGLPMSNHVLCRSSCEDAVRRLAYPLVAGRLLSEKEVAFLLWGNTLDCANVSRSVHARLEINSTIPLQLGNICRELPVNWRCLML